MQPEQDDKSHTATDVIGGTTEMAALPSEPRRLRGASTGTGIWRGKARRWISIAALLVLAGALLLWWQYRR